MAIYKYEDGTMGTMYEKGFLGEYPRVEYPTIDEIIEYIESFPAWDDVETEVYIELCEQLELDYHSYYDLGPDYMWDDIKEKWKIIKENKEI